MRTSLKAFDRSQWLDQRISVIALIASNCIPLIGVALFGWRVFDIVFLYWLENVIIGIFNAIKMITCMPGELDKSLLASQSIFSSEQNEEMLRKAKLDDDDETPAAFHAQKLFLVPFFCVHYGIFCLVHGVFIVVLLSGDGVFSGGGAPDPFESAGEQLGQFWILIAVLGLVASHLTSYFANFIGKGEYRKTHPIVLMISPYGRIIVLHVAIIASAFLSIAFGSPVWMLVLLVFGKIWLDVILHMNRHCVVAEAPPDSEEPNQDLAGLSDP